MLWNRGSEYAEIEGFRRLGAALGKLVLRDVSGKLDAVQMREASLPARKRCAPVEAVRNIAAFPHPNFAPLKLRRL